MIKIDNIEVFGWEAAIRGMRNPMNSWDKSDSWPFIHKDAETKNYLGKGFHIGENDLKLMQSLIKAGTDHSKFMRMITVTMDITAPMYFNKELDTYKVGTIRNSCSTMHKIYAKEFTLDDFSYEHLDGYSLHVLEDIIFRLNDNRNYFIETKDKDFWWQMIQLLPSSYNQRRTLMLNYEVLANMYKSRKDHKLDEWRDFCKLHRNRESAFACRNVY